MDDLPMVAHPTTRQLRPRSSCGRGSSGLLPQKPHRHWYGKPRTPHLAWTAPFDRDFEFHWPAASVVAAESTMGCVRTLRPWARGTKGRWWDGQAGESTHSDILWRGVEGLLASCSLGAVSLALRVCVWLWKWQQAPACALRADFPATHPGFPNQSGDFP